MKLKELHINGYKNLKDKTVFNFVNCTNYVALIGLNGSGKSNVLEAISRIIHSHYSKKEPITDFTYKMVYELDSKEVKLENNKVYVNNRERKNNIKDFLPPQIIACYSGEETRLWEDVFQKPYLKYFNRIKLNYQSQKLRFLYINKFNWSSALLTLLCHTDSQDFVKELLGITDIQTDVKIKFVYSDKYEDRKDKFSLGITTAFTIPQLTDRLKTEQERNPATTTVTGDETEQVLPDTERTLKAEADQYLTLSEITGIDLSNIEHQNENNKWCRQFFEYLFLATMPKIKKLITDIKIEFDDKDVRKLSEGEKKLILINLINNVLANDNALVLLDEPDSHVHLEKKKEILDSIRNNSHTSLFTTHSPTICKYCRRENVYQLDDGEVSGLNTLYEGIEYLVDEDDVLKTMFSSKDIIICEGKTDDLYISKALSHFQTEYPLLNFDFMRVGGTDADNIKHVLDKFSTEEDKKIIIMVDRDEAGYKVYKSLFPTSSRAKQDIDFEKYNGKDNIFFLMIPPINPANVSSDFQIENYFQNTVVKNLAKNHIDNTFLDNVAFSKFPNVGKELKQKILKDYCNASTPVQMENFKILLNKLNDIIQT